jgi:SAM-dependent methyltransferase
VARAQHGAVRPPTSRDVGAALTEHDPKAEQYARKAAAWSDAEYADGNAYLAHRAELVASLGVGLRAGDEVLDLACGDGGLGPHLLARGLRYSGVDSEPAMVAAARRRLGEAATVALGDLDTFAPEEPVAATTVFRAIYYADDRAAFFRRVAAFTERKLVFDLNPRQYPLDVVLAELEAAGFSRVELRPFFVPQTRRLPRPAVPLLQALERVGPVARLALRVRFTYLVAAVRY